VIQNPGFLPEHAQNRITGILCHARRTLKISEKYLADSQTDETDKQTKTSKNITSLAEGHIQDIMPSIWTRQCISNKSLMWRNNCWHDYQSVSCRSNNCALTISYFILHYLRKEVAVCFPGLCHSTSSPGVNCSMHLLDNDA